MSKLIFSVFRIIVQSLMEWLGYIWAKVPNENQIKKVVADAEKTQEDAQKVLEDSHKVETENTQVIQKTEVDEKAAEERIKDREEQASELAKKLNSLKVIIPFLILMVIAPFLAGATDQDYDTIVQQRDTAIEIANNYKRLYEESTADNKLLVQQNKELKDNLQKTTDQLQKQTEANINLNKTIDSLQQLVSDMREGIKKILADNNKKHWGMTLEKSNDDYEWGIIYLF